MIKGVKLKVDGVGISGQLYLPDGQPPYPTVVICHGIPAAPREPGDRGYPLLAEKIGSSGFAVLIFSFRGTGASGGDFDILGWVRDLEAVIDYLYALPEVDRTHLALVGFSGGAAVSVCSAAGDKRVSSVATCACPAEFFFSRRADRQATIDHFRSIGLFRSEGFPASIEGWFRGFEQVSPINHVARIAPRPLLLVHGGADEVVLPSHARRLYQKAGEPKMLAMVEGAGHRLRLDERAMDTVIEWLKANLRIDPQT